MDKNNQKNKYTIARLEREKHVDAVVNAQSSKKIVVAGPGTGKTFLFKSILKGKKKTLTLTFINALVADLSLELFGISDVKTLHGFARSQLAKTTSKGIMVFPKLSEVIKEDAKILLGNEIDYDSIFNNRDDNNQNLVFYKKRKNYYGYYGFSDMVFAAVLYFEQYDKKIPSYSQIVVDEYQDFNKLEVSLINILSKKSPILLAGDDDQAIYAFKDASANYIREKFNISQYGYTPFSLPYCSRCTRVIVQATNDIIDGATRDGFLKERINKKYIYFEDEKKDKESKNNPFIIYSKLHAGQIPWLIQMQIADIAKQVHDKFTVLILSPARIQSRSIINKLKSKGFENTHFVDKKFNPEPTLMDGLLLLLKNKKCNLGWRIVLKELIEYGDFQTLIRETDKIDQSKQLWEMVETKDRKVVNQWLTTMRSVRDGKEIKNQEVLTSLLQQVGIDAEGLAKVSLKEKIDASSTISIEAGIKGISITGTTIQGSKGLSADYVFITHFDDQYFVKANNKSKLSDQDICNFIVALTRARRKVFLLSTNTNKEPILLKWLDKSYIKIIETSGVSKS